MLRLPPTTIELGRKDLDWHYRRSAERVEFNAFNQRQLFAYSEFRRRNPTLLGETLSASVDHDPAKDDPVRCRSTNVSGAPSWEEVLIKSRCGPLETATSPTLPSPRVRPVQQSDTESSESAAYDTSDGASFEEGIRIPHTLDPNIQQQEYASEENSMSTTRSQFDGNYDGDDGDEDDNDSGGAPIPPATRSAHSRHPASALTLPVSPVPLPSRLRTISGTAPQLGSPLRFNEAVEASSSPERPVETALAQLQSLFEQAQSTPRGASGQHSGTRTEHSTDFHLDRNVANTATHPQSEIFSPGHDADLQLLRTRRTSVTRPTYRVSLRLASGDTVIRNRSTSTGTQLNGIALQNLDESLADGREMVDVNHPVDEIQNSTSARVRSRLLRVYDDEQSPTSQPQTPIGLPRRGVAATMSIGGSFTAPARRPRRLSNPSSPRFRGVINGQEFHYRWLEGNGQQENIGDTELFRQQEQERRRQHEMARRGGSNSILETTPPSRRPPHDRRR